jgi:putative spermidine/putrescine transport system substrate-binding protein
MARAHRHNGRAQTDDARQNVEEDLTTTRTLPRLVTLGAALAFVAAACGGGGATNGPGATTPGATGAGGGSPAAAVTPWVPDPALMATAKTEGELRPIAEPRDWCNYGALFDIYTARVGIPVNVINPNFGSGQEIEAIKANLNGGPAAPDVVDVGISYGTSENALFEPYKVANWDTIPAEDKDPSGAWYTGYYGVLSFEVNKDIVKDVPQDWADLLKPGMKVAIAGDPLNSNQAVQTVYASALATSNGGSLDNAQPGLDFFKKLNDAGNFVPTVAKLGSLVSGETPIVITWSYLALADRDSLAGTTDVGVVIPATGRFAGKYIQAISKTAPHPAAAKLWEELLYSDEGQTTWLTPPAYCITARFADLKTRNVIPADVLAKLPDVAGAVFPSIAQSDAAKALITANWKSVTGVGVFKTAPPAP